MKAKNWILSFVTLAMGVSPAMAQQTGEYAKMNKFIDNLMSKMTLQEKLGQLNLPVTGEIVTGQAKSSDVAGKIKRGEVGGLFNLKGVKNIKEVPKNCSRTKSLENTTSLWNGRNSRLRNRVPDTFLVVLFMGYGGNQAVCSNCSSRGFG